MEMNPGTEDQIGNLSGESFSKSTSGHLEIVPSTSLEEDDIEGGEIILNNSSNAPEEDIFISTGADGTDASDVPDSDDGTEYIAHSRVVRHTRQIEVLGHSSRSKEVSSTKRAYRFISRIKKPKHISTKRSRWNELLQSFKRMTESEVRVKKCCKNLKRFQSVNISFLIEQMNYPSSCRRRTLQILATFYVQFRQFVCFRWEDGMLHIFE